MIWFDKGLIKPEAKKLELPVTSRSFESEEFIHALFRVVFYLGLLGTRLAVSL